MRHFVITTTDGLKVQAEYDGGSHFRVTNPETLGEPKANLVGVQRGGEQRAVMFAAHIAEDPTATVGLRPIYANGRLFTWTRDIVSFEEV